MLFHRIAPIGKRDADVLFQIVTDMLNRLMHHREAIVIPGTSFCMKGSTPDQ